MRKFAVGLMVLASAITCNAANAGHEGFFRSPVISHHPFFFHKPFFGNHRFSNFSFPVIFAPYYPYYAPYYLSYDYEANYGPTTSIQQAAEPAAPAPEPAAPQVWYYCNPATGYHPYVETCRAGWYQVSATPPPPSAPQP